jgi:hypothetical protein
MFLHCSSAVNSGCSESSLSRSVIFACPNEVANALVVAFNVIFFWFVDVTKISWSQGVSEEIKIESKAVKNRDAAYEENVDATLRPVVQFFVNANFAPGLVRIDEQSAEFLAGIVAEAVAVAHSLPCPLKVSQFFLRIVQVLVAKKFGKETLSCDCKGPVVGKLGGMEISINPRYENLTFRSRNEPFLTGKILRGIYAGK